MKKLFSILILITMSVSAFAEEQERDCFFMPILNYEHFEFDNQQIHSPALGMIITKGNITPSFSESPNNLMITAMYKQYYINKVEIGYASLYHNILLNTERKINRHLFYGNLQSQSSEPFIGGLHTFMGMLGYGNELIRNEYISLTIGGILMIMDSEIEMTDGIIMPVMPMPIARFNLDTSYLELFIEFMGNTRLEFTLLPENKIRLTWTFEINPFLVRNIKDLFFDTTLWYRFFSKESVMGDFAGIGIGFRNSGLGMGMTSGSFTFHLSEKDKNYELNYFSVYGILDLSFIKISGGYLFNGREIYDKELIRNIGDGFFINALLLWRF